MYYPNEFGLELAEALGLPKHLVRYELKFAYDSPPMVHCEMEIWDESDATIKQNVRTVFEKYRITAERIEEKKEEKE